MKNKEYDNNGVIPYDDAAMAPTGVKRTQKLGLTDGDGTVNDEKYFENGNCRAPERSNNDR